MAGDLLVAEEVRRPSAGQHEVVILDFAYRGEETLTLGSHPDDISQTEDKVLLPSEGCTEGEGDRTRLQPRRCYLVDQRGELMVIVMVNEDDLEEASVEVLGELESCESPACDDDAGECRLG